MRQLVHLGPVLLDLSPRLTAGRHKERTGERPGNGPATGLEAAGAPLGTSQRPRGPPGGVPAHPGAVFALPGLLGGNGHLGPADEPVGGQTPAEPVALGRGLAQPPAGPDLMPVQRTAHDGVGPPPGCEIRPLFGWAQEGHHSW